MSHRRGPGPSNPDRSTSGTRLDRTIPESSRLRSWAWGVLLCATGLLAYANSFQGVFLLDDEHSITRNPHIQRLWPLTAALTAAPQSGTAGRPVLSLTLALNYAAGGLNPWGYHLFNLIVHLAAGLALYGVLRRTLLAGRLRERYGPSADTLAGVTALIWAVHPLQTESVTYIVQRAESLMGLFYLLTLYCALRGWTATRPLRWQLAGILACGLGMATKEVMVTAPFIVLLHDAVFDAGSIRGALRKRPWFYAGLAGTWAILAALMASGPRSGSVGFSHGVTAFQYALNQCEAITDYLRLAVWPHPLIFDYGVPRPLTLAQVAPAAAGLAVLLAATVIGLVRSPQLGFLGAWFFVILGPTSSFVPITTEVAAERRMYLPLAAVILLVVLGMTEALKRLSGHGPMRLGRRRLAVFGITLGVVCVLTFQTHRRNELYHDQAAMYRDTMALRPDNARARINLGKALVLRGESDDGVNLFRQALEIDPDSAAAHYNLGNTLHRQGRFTEALAEYTKALDTAPDMREAQLNMGAALFGLKRYDDAVAYYLGILRDSDDPLDTQIHCNLGMALVRAGRTEEGLSHLREALWRDRDHSAARHNLADILLELGRNDEAAIEYRELLRSHPEDREARAGLDKALSRPNEAARQ